MNNEILKTRLAEIRAESEALKQKFAGDKEGYSQATKEMERKFSKRNEIERAEKMRKKTERKLRRTLMKEQGRVKRPKHLIEKQRNHLARNAAFENFMKDETAQTISKPPVKTNPEPLPIVESPQPVKQAIL